MKRFAVFKKTCVILSFLMGSSLLLHGQAIKTVTVGADVAKIRKFNLSEIAEKVTPIPLDRSSMIQDIFLTNEYLFVASLSSVFQFTASGKFIREIACGGFVTSNVSCDTIKKELYIPVGKEIKCYDFAGNLKKTYEIENRSLNCCYYENNLWILSYAREITQNEFIVDYKLSRLNLLTGKEFFSPLKFQEKEKTTANSFAISTAYFSVYGNAIIASISTDSIMYEIRGEKASPFLKWAIMPSEQGRPLGKKGFIGKYLFINYHRDNHIYQYLKDMKSGKIIDFERATDDVFNTGNISVTNPINRDGYFFFTKTRDEIQGQTIGNLPLKEGTVIFIVKIK
jgi:hypothetical protein